MPERHVYGTVTKPNSNIWTETLDHVLSLIGIFCGRAGLCSSSTPGPGLWAMSLLSALSLVCGLMLHVSFSTPNTHYGIPRKTVPYQSKLAWLSCLFFFCACSVKLWKLWVNLHFVFVVGAFFSQQLKCRKEHIIKSRVVTQMFSCLDELKSFREDGIFNYSTMLLRDDLDVLLLGAREAIYALDINNISVRKAVVRGKTWVCRSDECCFLLKLL